MSTRNFFLGAVLSMGLVLGTVAATNYLVDVRGVYGDRTDFVHDYVERLRHSRLGLVMPHTSERKIKYELVSRFTADCYVTGSSHEMTITRDSLPGLQCGSLLNLAASGGGYEDAIAMMDAVADRRGATVIVGMGPWFFKANTDAHWQELSEAYGKARNTFFDDRARPGSMKKWENLVNGEYFVRNLAELGASSDAAAIREEPSDDDAMFRPDGSLLYSRNYIRAASSRSEVAECTDYKISSPFVYDYMVDEMERAVSHLQRQGVRVVFLLMPYHPGVFQCRNKTPAALAATEQAARQLAATLGVTVLGGYDSRRFGLTGNDFYDYMHIDADSVSKVTAAQP